MQLQIIIKKIRRKRVLLPLLVVILEIAAYAQKMGKEKDQISGHLKSPLMSETSGATASAIHQGIYYMHNDSGDTSRYFAVTADGTLKATYYFKPQGTAKLGVTDCEDIAIGPGPVAGKSYVYLGDIGDNGSGRKFITIYRMPESPLPASADSVQHVPSVAFNLKYPDGSHDAETLMVDPVEKVIYIISKREKDVGIYSAPLDLPATDTVTLTKRGTIHFGGLRPFKWVTAGSISHDGQQVLLKTYTKVYYWKRKANESIWQTMLGQPKQLIYEQEKQGESIAFAPDGKSYITTSEGNKAPIYHYFLPKN